MFWKIYLQHCFNLRIFAPSNLINYNIMSDKENTPWWQIALKVVVYAIGLILAGVGTTTTASAMGILPTPW